MGGYVGGPVSGRHSPREQRRPQNHGQGSGGRPATPPQNVSGRGRRRSTSSPLPVPIEVAKNRAVIVEPLTMAAQSRILAMNRGLDLVPAVHPPIQP